MEEVTTLKAKVADGEEYFAVAHIFASFNDTFVVSDMCLLAAFLDTCTDILFILFAYFYFYTFVCKLL